MLDLCFGEHHAVRLVFASLADGVLAQLVAAEAELGLVGGVGLGDDVGPPSRLEDPRRSVTCRG